MLKIDFKNINKKELLLLPVRNWQEVSIYDTIFIVPTRKKHESGYRLLAIVGIKFENDYKLAEIAAYCDDVMWSFPKSHPYGKYKPDLNSNILRMDCFYPSSVIRCWASSEHYFKGTFKVGVSLSSTEIELVVNLKQEV